MIRNLRTLTSVALIFALTVTASLPSGRSAYAYERKSPYSGPKLTSTTLMCKASQLAAAGFWRNLRDGSVEESARIEQEPKPTFWRIAISSAVGTAQVVRFNANLEAFEAPVIFSAEDTPGGGLLLIRTERERGTSPEAISIDPANSSFVYSSQHASVFYNRANIWYGSCKPYQ